MSEEENDPTPGDPAAEAEATAEAHRNLAGRARHAVLWVGSTTVVWQVFSWGLTILTARVLLPEDYGILSLTETIAPFLGMLAALNLSIWIVQTERFEAAERSAMYSLTTLTGAAMAAVGVAIAPLLGVFFENADMVLPFQVVSLVFAVRGTAVVPLAMLQRAIEFKPFALMNMVVGISSGALQLGLAFAGFGYWSLVAGIVYREVASAVWAHWHVGLPRSLSWNPALFREAIAFGAPTTLAVVAHILFSSSDKIVIGRLFDVELLGFYAMAFFLTDLPLARINTVLRPVFLPYFAQLRGHPDRMRSHFAKYVLAVNSLIFPVLIGLAVVAPIVVGVVLGDKWLPMVAPLQVLCLVGLVRSFVDNVPHLLLALGRPRDLLRMHLIYLVVMSTSFAALGWRFGIDGIYWTWLAVFPSLSIVTLRILRRAAEIRAWDYVSNLFPPLLSSAFMAAATWGAQQVLEPHVPQIPLIVALIGIGVASYAAFYWLVFREVARGIVSAVRGNV